MAWRWVSILRARYRVRLCLACRYLRLPPILRKSRTGSSSRGTFYHRGADHRLGEGAEFAAAVEVRAAANP
jgi:hypothetical protein